MVLLACLLLCRTEVYYTGRCKIIVHANLYSAGAVDLFSLKEKYFSTWLIHILDKLNGNQK